MYSSTKKNQNQTHYQPIESSSKPRTILFSNPNFNNFNESSAFDLFSLDGSLGGIENIIVIRIL